MLSYNTNPYIHRPQPVPMYTTQVPYQQTQYIGRSYLPINTQPLQQTQQIPPQHYNTYSHIPTQYPQQHHIQPQQHVQYQQHPVSMVTPAVVTTATVQSTSSPASSVTVVNESTTEHDLSPTQTPSIYNKNKRKQHTTVVDSRSIRRAKHREVEIRRRVKLAALVNELTDVLGVGAVDKCTLLAEAIKVIRVHKNLPPSQNNHAAFKREIPSDTDIG